VNIADIMAIAIHWRMTEADPDWDPRHDVDLDGDIDIVDIMKVAANWGASCW